VLEDERLIGVARRKVGTWGWALTTEVGQDDDRGRRLRTVIGDGG
jgi:hypothetical protein